MKSGITIGALLLACVGAFVGWRLTRPDAPAMVETAARVETAAKVATVTTRTIRSVERKPDGGTVTVATVERIDLASEVRTVAKQTTITEARAKWRVQGSAGWSKLQARPDLYRVEGSRRVVGPVWLGVWVQSDKSAGLSLALEW